MLCHLRVPAIIIVDENLKGMCFGLGRLVGQIQLGGLHA